MIAISEHIKHRPTLITMKSILTVPIDLETKHVLRTFQKKEKQRITKRSREMCPRRYPIGHSNHETEK